MTLESPPVSANLQTSHSISSKTVVVKCFGQKATSKIENNVKNREKFKYIISINTLKMGLKLMNKWAQISRISTSTNTQHRNTAHT